MMAKAGKSKKKLTFEEAFERLEELTEALERGNLDLEATLKAFKEGRGLLKYCEELLGEAEETLKIIDLDAPQGAAELGKEEKE